MRLFLALLLAALSFVPAAIADLPPNTVVTGSHSTDPGITNSNPLVSCSTVQYVSDIYLRADRLGTIPNAAIGIYYATSYPSPPSLVAWTQTNGSGVFQFHTNVPGYYAVVGFLYPQEFGGSSKPNHLTRQSNGSCGWSVKWISSCSNQVWNPGNDFQIVYGENLVACS